MTSDPLYIALVVSIPPTIAAIAAVIAAVRTHNAVNSRMSELLELARKESAASATLAEKDAEKLRRADKIAAVAASGGKPP